MLSLHPQGFFGGLPLVLSRRPGAPHPRFPVKLSWFHELHAPFLKERRTRCHVQGRVQELRGISLVFREMWDTTDVDAKCVGRIESQSEGALASAQNGLVESRGSPCYLVGSQPALRLFSDR